MMRTAGNRQPRYGAAPIAARNSAPLYAGYRFSLLAPPPARTEPRTGSDAMPYTIRAVAPSLRPLMARTGNRCPDCGGPLVSGEGCVACPVCGFRRQGW
jgi:DNA-directed RNA polymerase subunit RPC12/RpoP